MASFGQLLKELRTLSGLRQIDVAGRLGGVARSTLANVETGREPPSPRLWGLLSAAFPDWVDLLADAYLRERGMVGPVAAPDREAEVSADGRLLTLGGPFIVERLTLCYVFEFGRSPSEIIESRRVRANRNGAHSYVLRLHRENDALFEADAEALWGGRIRRLLTADARGRSVQLTEFVFDRTLARGATHEFAVRSWVERDPTPSCAVTVAFTIPAKEVCLELQFRGPIRPRGYSIFGPVRDDAEVPEEPGSAPRLPFPDSGRVVSHIDAPIKTQTYGIAWEW